MFHRYIQEIYPFFLSETVETVRARVRERTKGAT
jgi:hypothetical protein